MGLTYRDAFVAIAAVKLETVVDFYMNVLKQPPQSFLPGTYAEFCLTGGLKLGIFKPKASHEAEFSGTGQSGISLCLEVDDLDGAIAHLTRLGYPPPGAIETASHGREVYAYDPAGNRLILHESRSAQVEMDGSQASSEAESGCAAEG